MKKTIALVSLTILMSNNTQADLLKRTCALKLNDPVSLNFLKDIDNIFKSETCSAVHEVRLKSELDKVQCSAMNLCAENVEILLSNNF